MKKSLLLAGVSFLALQSAFADLVLIQKATTDGQVQEINVKIKGDKTRMDMGEQMTVIYDGATSNMVMLMHAQKVMMKMDEETLKSMMAMAGSALGGTAPAAKPVATGEKEKIGEHECEIYTWSGQLGTGKFWIAKDFPHYQELNAAQDKMTKAMGSPVSGMLPQASDFPGMVVKSELILSGKSNVSELVSMKEETVEEAVFVPPTDYQEMKMPGIPGK
ncbi:uncharacterized protein DUF4412 [Prosthecobacter fusiformis]|uniref:Uncharacterized protein DUF4412 n=1 Tax=Prosthecobacter fusiformis TaxID=48464 RepID=A0A4R7S262_9BACT|nr:DUF4412 domain-containing protein [Prosthecobacter fusiformis]TDU71087.1 uncharacterized protein DUF4412 [Prosthecobacter fusiformis]